MNDNAASATETRSRSELVDANVEAWNTRDGEAVLASMAPGATYIEPKLPEPVSGEAFVDYVQSLATAFPDYVFTWQTFEAPERVTLHWTMSGTFTGPLDGLPGPTGASFALPGVSLYEVGAEGITDIEVYFDQVGFLSQLGIGIDLSVGAPSA